MKQGESSMTHVEIGKLFGITKQGVLHAEKKAIRKLWNRPIKIMFATNQLPSEFYKDILNPDQTNLILGLKQ